jgi:hypothetical protein
MYLIAPAIEGREALLADDARRHHGLTTRRRLIELGYSDKSISNLVRHDRLHRVYPGVFAVGYPAGTREAAWNALVLFGGDGAALGGLAAAAHWGISRYPVREVIVVTQAPRTGQANGRFQRTRSWRARDAQMFKGIRTCSVARTVLDLGDVLTAHQLANILHEADYRRRLNRHAIADVIERNRGRRAVTVLRRAMVLNEGNSAGTKSDCEDRALGGILAAGLAVPEVNVSAPIQGEAMQVDLLWRHTRLVVEVDGAGHRRQRTIAQDAARDRRLLASGFTIIRWRGRHLDLLVQTVAAHLAEPSATAGRMVIE